MAKVAFFSKEVGESGTPHLQGYVEFIKKCRPSSLFDHEIWWSKSRGSRQENFDYCTGSDELVYCKGMPKPIKVIDPNYPWEKDILDIIKEEPDDRSIHWYWDDIGGAGKTSFCKYLVVKHKAIILGGKSADMRNAIVEYKKENGETPSLIIINIPRSFNSDYLSYEGIENIKDMVFYSGKYEGGMICGNCPHVIVFSNEPPQKDKMSMDRWHITRIVNV